MKILVTHINPHLDDIAAIWLFKKFHADFKNADLEFISAHEGNHGLPDTAEKVHFGVGQGRFDEHKGDLNDCATSLVWKEIKSSNLVSRNETELQAYEELVEWSRLIDTGGMPIQQFDEFSVASFIRPHETTTASSKEAVLLGEKILDRILAVLKRKQKAQTDWEKKIDFQSSFGPSCAVNSQYVNRDFCQRQKGVLFLMYHPQYKSMQFFTPLQEIDLTPLYKKLQQLDPQASWYLHHSKHFILCGAGSDPKFTPTKLSFEQLIDVAKGV